MRAVLDRRDSFTSHRDDSGQVGWLASEGITLVRGHGRLAGERTVEVEQADGTTVTLTARHAVVLATGTRAAMPPVPGLREARALDQPGGDQRRAGPRAAARGGRRRRRRWRWRRPGPRWASRSSPWCSAAPDC